MTTNGSTQTVIPLKGMRGMIAEKMHNSLASTAQLTHHAECDVSALLRRRGLIREHGGTASVQDLLMYYVTATLVEHPALNGTLEDGEIRLSEAVHLSIAVSLENGLLVAPALFDAQAMSLEALATARRELTERAHAGKLSVKEMTGGTATVSNLGLTRVRFFTPILNAPQIAIVGIGGTEERLTRAPDGSIAGRPYMGLSLTFDHRAVNGAPAAAFLDALCQRIEQAPEPS
ncbi:2-oxo acid dehydrogenase subunit E2 [Arhodomonas sp. AD133]|uniref:2-oxo acid dehydrogenase subunit E2 n=1 Tax=Arhodomonas sp. AD133 TaxID=3415009 RepID=UPI003EB6C245